MVTSSGVSFLEGIFVPFFGDTLGKVDLDASVVHEGVVHFKEGFVAGLGVGKFDKGIVQTGARIGIANDFSGAGPKPGKNEFQIIIVRGGVQLTHKQDILGCRDIGRRQIPQHFQHHRPTAILLLLHRFFLIRIVRSPILHL
eukprot:scaffold119137_cov36-Attheya_sp.AAC.1